MRTARTASAARAAVMATLVVVAAALVLAATAPPASAAAPARASSPVRRAAPSSAAVSRSAGHALRAAPNYTGEVLVLLVPVSPVRGTRAGLCRPELASGPAVAGGDPVNAADPSGECILCWSTVVKSYERTAQMLTGGPLISAALNCPSESIGAIWNCEVEQNDPAFSMLYGYYMEGQASQDPCTSDWTIAGYALQGTLGFVGTFAPLGGLAGGGPETALPRLPQDVEVDPNPPPANDGNSNIGTNPAQAGELQADLAQLSGDPNVFDVRVNQQQVNALLRRVGINRPDLQYTLGTQRYYVEYDQNVVNSWAHYLRIKANDPNGVIILKVIQ